MSMIGRSLAHYLIIAQIGKGGIEGSKNLSDKTLFLLLVIAIFMIFFGCAKPKIVIPPDKPEIKACVVRAENELHNCEMQVSLSHDQCIEKERKAAQVPYEKALRQYERYVQEDQRKFERELRNWEKESARQRAQYERCENEQINRTPDDSNGDLSSNILSNCSRYQNLPLKPSLPFRTQPSLVQFMNSASCDKEKSSSAKHCQEEFEASVGKCGLE